MQDMLEQIGTAQERLESFKYFTRVELFAYDQMTGLFDGMPERDMLHKIVTMLEEVVINIDVERERRVQTGITRNLTERERSMYYIGKEMAMRHMAIKLYHGIVRPKEESSEWLQD